MMPIISDRLIESLKLTQEMLEVFGKKCVQNIKPNKLKLKEHLENSMATATILTPILGYDVVTNAVQLAIQTGKSLKAVLLEKKLLSETEFLNLTK